MALKINRPGRTFDYVLEADRESTQKTIFRLRRLTWEELSETIESAPLDPGQADRVREVTKCAHAEQRDLTAQEIEEINEIVPDGVARVLAARKLWAMTCMHGVVEIRGLLDEEGAPLIISVDTFVQNASPTTLQELWMELQRLSRLSEDIEKN